MKKLMDKLFTGQAETQEDFNSLFIQMVVDLNARLAHLEDKKEECNRCCVCNSEFVVGVCCDDNEETSWFCETHIPRNVIYKTSY